MSETPQKILVRQWIRRAENDLLNVRNNLAAQEIPWDRRLKLWMSPKVGVHWILPKPFAGIAAPT